MTRSRIRGGVAAALVMTTAALVTAATPTSAFASHSGTGDSVLTSYDGTAIHLADGSSIPAAGVAGDSLAWSPDGSRAAFFGHDSSSGLDNAVFSVHYSDGSSAKSIKMLAGFAGQRSHPSWSGGGTQVFFAERSGPTAQWKISFGASGWFSRNFTPWEEQVSPTADQYDYTWPDAGAPGHLVAQQQLDDGSGNPTGDPNVVAFDLATDAMSTVISNASEPAISPLSDRVAFVRDGQIWTSDMTGGNLTQITADSDTHDEPTWSPDGTRIAFRTQDPAGNSIGTAAADGSEKDAPVVVQGLAYGVPAYQTRNPNHVTVLAGTNRFQTAVAISKELWADAGVDDPNRLPANSVTLTRSDTFADAVSGSALAAAKQGPLLMTKPAIFDPDTKAEIQRVLPQGKTVYILGSTSAISASTENAIKAMGYNTHRIAGTDRYDTSVRIAKTISPNPAYVFLATGLNFPDALGAGAAAGSFDLDTTSSDAAPAVVLLTRDKAMPAATENYLESFLDSQGFTSQLITAVGSQASTALWSMKWFGYINDVGTNRYETSRKVAEDWFAGEYSAGVTTGRNWPDALAGGAFLAELNGPLLLTDPANASLDANAAAVLGENSGAITDTYIFGATLPSAINGQIGTDISGPGGFDASSAVPTLSMTEPNMLSQAAKQLRIAGMKMSAHAGKAMH